MGAARVGRRRRACGRSRASLGATHAIKKTPLRLSSERGRANEAAERGGGGGELRRCAGGSVTASLRRVATLHTCRMPPALLAETSGIPEVRHHEITVHRRTSGRRAIQVGTDFDARRGMSQPSSQRDPRADGKKPPFPEKTQSAPGRETEMRTKPDHGEESYRGYGRLSRMRARAPTSRLRTSTSTTMRTRRSIGSSERDEKRC